MKPSVHLNNWYWNNDGSIHYWNNDGSIHTLHIPSQEEYVFESSLDKVIIEAKQLEATVSAIENAQLRELVDMFIAWANITVTGAHEEYDDPRGESACRGADWRGELASGHYDIWEKLPEHIQEAILNYEWPRKDGT